MSDDDVYDVEAIVARRVVSGRTEYLVKWKGYDEESWEPSANILDKELIKAFRKDSKKKRKGRPPKVRPQDQTVPDSTEENGGDEESKQDSSSVIQDVQDPEVSSGGDLLKNKYEKPRLIPKKETKDTKVVDEVKVAPLPTQKMEVDKEEKSELREVVGATEINGQIYFLVKWRDENKELEPMCSSEANVKYPRQVIAFYEKHFEWISQ